MGLEDDSHCVLTPLECEWVQVEASEDERWDVAVAHVDMGPHFWAKHSYVFDRR